jgi:nucleotide-binding universal stress UspA family protein
MARHVKEKPSEDVMIALKHILVATDFGPAADAALTYGRTLADTFDATLHLLHVTADVNVGAANAECYLAINPAWEAEAEESIRRRLSALTDMDGGGLRTRIAVEQSYAPAAGILQYAKHQHVDLIVMGTHGRGALAHLFMGSVAETVVRNAPCPVLTVHHPEHEFVVPELQVAHQSA